MIAPNPPYTAPVLLLHSGGFTSRQWRKLGELLAPRYRVMAPELIGYGAVRWPDNVPFQFGADVARLAEQVDEPTHIVGHSYGGLLALQLALVKPAAIRSITAYEPVTFGVLDQPDDAAAHASLAQIGRYHADRAEDWFESFVDWWQGPGAWRGLADATKQTFREVGWKLSQEVASLSADRTGRARYATITAPALILAGERTNPVELRTVQRLVEALPNATLEVFPGMGHMGPITHAAQVNTVIAAFLDGQPAG